MGLDTFIVGFITGVSAGSILFCLGLLAGKIANTPVVASLMGKISGPGEVYDDEYFDKALLSPGEGGLENEPHFDDEFLEELARINRHG